MPRRPRLLFSPRRLPLSNLYLSALTYPNPRRPISSSSKSCSNLVFCNSQVTKHGRNGNIQEAQRVFDGMPLRDVVSWTALLTAYAENEEIATARKLFDEMPKRNTASWNAIISAYVRASMVSDAYELFLKMPMKNVVSYGAMISGFGRTGMLREAEGLYNEVPRIWRDPVASNALMCGYLRAGQLDEAVRIFREMEVKDVISWSSIVDGFCKHGDIFNAREVFDAMPERNVVSWTSMIRGYLKVGLWEDGFRLFVEMRRAGIRINTTTLSVVLDACDRLCRVREGIQIHSLIMAMGFGSDVFVGNSIITMYSRAGWMTSARKAFDGLNMRDVVSWNCLIAGYVKQDAIEEANVLFELMPKKDVVTWTSMVFGFSNRGWMSEAVFLFEQMPEQDEVAWTAVISGFVSNGKYESALEWFDCMLQEGYTPNSVTLSCVLKALTGLVLLDQGMQIHALAVKMDLGFDVAVQSSLVSMYAKCGKLEGAYQMFLRINEPSIITVNSMIMAFAQHGLAEEALGLFPMTQRNGCNPNEVTFLGILSACVHAGLVHEGCKYFESMTSVYGIEPKLDHYTCMVDLLGRAGFLEEALDLINSMPYEANSDVWGALLNGSKLHSDLKLAKLAAQRLIEIEPNNATAYTVFSSMLSSAGLKEEEEKIRMAQQSNNVTKVPGYSWFIFDETARKEST